MNCAIPSLSRGRTAIRIGVCCATVSAVRGAGAVRAGVTCTLAVRVRCTATIGVCVRRGAVGVRATSAPAVRVPVTKGHFPRNNDDREAYQAKDIFIHDSFHLVR